MMNQRYFLLHSWSLYLFLISNVAFHYVFEAIWSYFSFWNVLFHAPNFWSQARDLLENEILNVWNKLFFFVIIISVFMWRKLDFEALKTSRHSMLIAIFETVSSSTVLLFFQKKFKISVYRNGSGTVWNENRTH